MGNFFDVIFGNMFVVIIIIGALMKLFGSKSKDQSEDEEARPSKQSEAKSVFQEVRKQFEEQFQEHTDTKRSNPSRKQTEPSRQSPVRQNNRSEQLGSVEEQREQQMNRLKQAYEKPHKDVNNEHSGLRKRAVNNQMSMEEHREALKLEKKLTQKGLIQSVIMAEVLGPPRALKPYQNRANNRNQ